MALQISATGCPMPHLSVLRNSDEKEDKSTPAVFGSTWMYMI